MLGSSLRARCRTAQTVRANRYQSAAIFHAAVRPANEIHGRAESVGYEEFVTDTARGKVPCWGMRIWKPTIQSFYGLLGGAQRSTRELDDAIGDIQEAMLSALGEAGAKKLQGVCRRIQYAPDLQALWYLRGHR